MAADSANTPDGTLMRVEVAYALPEQQYLLTVEVPEGASVEQAIQASGILKTCPEIDLSKMSVGVFSELATLETRLSANDRVEIYRPLQVDPKAQRRERAKAQQAGR